MEQKKFAYKINNSEFCDEKNCLRMPYVYIPSLDISLCREHSTYIKGVKILIK